MFELLGIAFSFIFGFGPMLFFAWLVYWTDRYEKEPLPLLGGVFLWGALVAAGGSFLINTILGMGLYLFTNSETATNLATGSIIAPVIEETLKGMAVLIVVLVFRHEFDSILDGIVYAAITAIGFAATENAFYIYSYGFVENGFGGAVLLVFVRVILVGWQHPFYTAFIGIGLGLARLSRQNSIRIGAPVAGWLIAVLTHGVHNTIAHYAADLGGIAIGTLVDWGGWLMMVVFVIWAVYRESRWLSEYLQEEVNLGTISPSQYSIACSTWSQSWARLKALVSGESASTRRFYQLCAELAYKKHQLATLGEEYGNTSIIARLRSELVGLSQIIGA
jgi:RsiW-degrading membrane proteinase PrsW (M82 family)